MFRIFKKKQPLLYHMFLEDDFEKVLTDAGLVDIQRKEKLVWEDIDVWIDTIETSSWHRHENSRPVPQCSAVRQKCTSFRDSTRWKNSGLLALVDLLWKKTTINSFLFPFTLFLGIQPMGFSSSSFDMRPTYIEIDVKKLNDNLDCIQRHLYKKDERKIPIMAIIKANAYGHGLVEIARNLEQRQIDYLGVAFLEEGELRRKEIHFPYWYWVVSWENKYLSLSTTTSP